MLDHDLLRVVADDLDFLTESWGSGELGPSELRRNSTVLRKLLCDRLLLNAWHMAVGQKAFNVPTWTIDEFTSAARRDRLLLATIGGARFHGARAGGLRLVRDGYRASSQIAKPPVEATEPNVRSVRLGKFVDGVCMIVHSVPIRRRHVIEYVANKMGGAHYDLTRDKREHRALDLVPTVMSTKERISKVISRGVLPLMVVEVTNDRGTFSIDPIYLETLSIGQWIADSPAVSELRAAIKVHLRPD